MPQFRIVTFNLLNKPSRWDERRILITTELAQLCPDLIALQEVSLPDNNAAWLAEQLKLAGCGLYTVHVSSKTGPLQGREGIAILSRLPVQRCRTLDLFSQGRVAQLVQVKIDGQSVILANGHFFFHVVDHVERVRQVEHFLNWLGSTQHGIPTIVCGDFNDTPASRSIHLMQQQFTSAHTARHGREPEYTCPTPLKYSFSSVRNVFSRLGNCLTTGSFLPWRGTIDYIFVSSRVNVMECMPVLNQPAPHDDTLYPSDHIGLTATLSLN